MTMLHLPDRDCDAEHADYRADLDLVTIVFHDDAVALGVQQSVVGFAEVEVHRQIVSGRLRVESVTLYPQSEFLSDVILAAIIAAANNHSHASMIWRAA